MSSSRAKDQGPRAHVKAIPLDPVRARKVALLIADNTPAPEMVRKLRGLRLDVPLNSRTFALSACFDPPGVTLKVAPRRLAPSALMAGEPKNIVTGRPG